MVALLDDSVGRGVVPTRLRERQTRATPTRALFLKYQDRVMFGTDHEISEAMYRNQFPLSRNRR